MLRYYYAICRRQRIYAHACLRAALYAMPPRCIEPFAFFFFFFIRCLRRGRADVYAATHVGECSVAVPRQRCHLRCRLCYASAIHDAIVDGAAMPMLLRLLGCFAIMPRR